MVAEEEERECPERYFSSADQTQVTFCRHDVDIGAGAQTERSKCAAVMGRLTRTSAGLCLL